MKKIVLRKARLSDVGMIHTLAKQVLLVHPAYSQVARKRELREYFSKKQLSNNIQNRDCVYVVATIDSSVVGFEYGIVENGVMWNAWTIVAPKHQGVGIAQKLNTFFESAYRKRGGWKIWTAIRTANTRSQKIAKKIGYRKICLLKKYWGKQDYYLFQKTL